MSIDCSEYEERTKRTPETRQEKNEADGVGATCLKKWRKNSQVLQKSLKIKRKKRKTGPNYAK